MNSPAGNSRLTPASAQSPLPPQPAVPWHQGASGGASGGKKDALTAGRYYKGMAVFTIVKGGAMYEATVAGQKFSFKPRSTPGSPSVAIPAAAVSASGLLLCESPVSGAKCPANVRTWTLSNRLPGDSINPMRILIVEDDAMIGASLVRGLTDEGYAVDWVRDGGSGRGGADRSPP